MDFAIGESNYSKLADSHYGTSPDNCTVKIQSLRPRFQ
jgi:hypothetical protein